MTTLDAAPLLAGIAGPADLRALPPDALPALAEEIRGFLVEHVCRTGGHLGPNLGVVELTIALHRVFDSPNDVLLFDTGHQSYVHKVLTGRGKDFSSLRQAGGLSGYPRPAESAHDVIENSHASTALSYADGIANAFALRGEPERSVVAVLGDGAMTGGMCWEALNNIGARQDRPLIVLLNDNGRSYSPTVGGLAAHLTELRNGGAPAAVFRGLGLAYLGPVDGHDVGAVEAALTEARALRRPVVVHCVTRKGRGYLPAERDELDHMHAVGATDPATGRPLKVGGPTWTTAFSDEITAIGTERSDVVCLTAAMLQPTGLADFATRFPDRVFDVGLAEQHLVTSAAGLALGGMRPVVAVYATFLNRAIDQLLMDVALHRLPVTFVLDRSGVTGPDGPSHHGMWDASLLPVVPGLRLAAPRDCASMRELLREALAVDDGPTAIRYPKAAAGPDLPVAERIGNCDVLLDCRDAEVLLVGVGPLAADCLDAAEQLAVSGVPVSVADPRWIAPLDPALLRLAGQHRLVVAVEDTTSTGALGGRLAQALAPRGSGVRVCTLALPPRFLPHASRSEILREHGLDAAGIVAAVRKGLAR
jgi:1-deoxy-D-xylulose-5-phosphate synthase